MQLTKVAIVTVLAAFATFSPAASAMADAKYTAAEIQAHEAKIAAKLLTAIHADDAVEADVMVQLESPEQVMHRVCGQDGDEPLTRAQKTTCMVDNMQQFADESQQQVKELLADHEGEYSEAMFFWINNSVAVKKAKGKLVLKLSALDTVLKIRPEKIFHTMGGGKKSHTTTQETEDGGDSATFGLGVVH